MRTLVVGVGEKERVMCMVGRLEEAKKERDEM